MKDVEGERFAVPVLLAFLFAFQISLPLVVMRNEAHVQLVRALSKINFPQIICIRYLTTSLNLEIYIHI